MLTPLWRLHSISHVIHQLGGMTLRQEPPVAVQNAQDLNAQQPPHALGGRATMAGESPTDLSKWGPGAGVGRASIMMLVACS